MTEYGFMVKGQLIKHRTFHDGDLPLIYAEKPIPPNGYVCVYRWKEKDDAIRQIWEFIEGDDGTEDGLSSEEALNIILGEES